jgi:hypothetical protein
LPSLIYQTLDQDTSSLTDPAFLPATAFPEKRNLQRDFIPTRSPKAAAQWLQFLFALFPLGQIEARQADRDEESEGCAGAQARRDHASDAGQWHDVLDPTSVAPCSPP